MLNGLQGINPQKVMSRHTKVNRGARENKLTQGKKKPTEKQKHDFDLPCPFNQSQSKRQFLQLFVSPLNPPNSSMKTTNLYNIQDRACSNCQQTNGTSITSTLVVYRFGFRVAGVSSVVNLS